MFTLIKIKNKNLFIESFPKVGWIVGVFLILPISLLALYGLIKNNSKLLIPLIVILAIASLGCIIQIIKCIIHFNFLALLFSIISAG